MKLQDYFHHQKHTFLTDNEKFSLYQEIVAKRDVKKSILQRYAFAKRMAYASFVVLFVMSVYGVHFFRDDLRYMTNSLIVQKAGDTVQAGYIAQIVHFDGSFVIEHNGKRLQTSVIRDGDLVTLRASTEMVFHIDAQTQAKIIGPAQFVLDLDDHEGNSRYTLQLLQGDFVEIQSLSDQTTQDITLISQDIVVHQDKADTASHFQISKQGDTKRIENKGSSIRISGIDTNGDTTVGAKQTLAIASNDISLIDDDTQIARIIIRKDVSQTIAFSNTREDIPFPAEDIYVDALSAVFDIDNATKKTIDTTVTSTVDTLIVGKDKKVVSPEQNNQLRSILYHGFLTQHIQSLFVAYVEGNNDLTTKALNALQDSLLSLYKLFEVDVVGYTKDSSVAGIAGSIELIKQLVTIIDKEYYVPPRYLHNIDTIGKWLDYLQSLGFGSQEDGMTAWTNLTTNTSSNLRFQ